MGVDIARAEMPEDLDAARALIRDFFAWAMENVAKGEKDPNPSVFANLEAELAGLPGRFGPPSGCLLLARLETARRWAVSPSMGRTPRRWRSSACSCWADCRCLVDPQRFVLSWSEALCDASVHNRDWETLNERGWRMPLRGH